MNKKDLWKLIREVMAEPTRGLDYEEMIRQLESMGNSGKLQIPR